MLYFSMFECIYLLPCFIGGVIFLPNWLHVCFAATVKYSRPRLATFWKYARVELSPPTPGEIPVAVESFKGLVASFKAGSYKQITVKVTKG